MDYNNQPPKIVFESEQFQRSHSFQTPTPKMVQWVITYSGGYIKDEKKASYFLMGFVGLTVIILLFLSVGGSKDTSKDIQEKFHNKPQFLP